MAISRGEQDFTVHGIEAGLRGDGRAPLAFRPVMLELGQMAQCTGSASCRLGSTSVLVGVKVEVGAPFPETPDQGGIEFHVDFMPSVVKGRQSESLGLELSRALTRSMQQQPSGTGGGIDLGALKIISGKRCWVVFVDAVVLNDDGNLLDALSIGTKAALANARLPHVEVSMTDEVEEPELELDDDPENSIPLDTSRVPVIVTISQAGRSTVVDLTAAEEAACSSGMHVAVNSKGAVVGVTKRGRAAVAPNTLMEMLGVAQKLGPQLLQSIDGYIEAASSDMVA